jgi:lipopolysaccharide export system permease protein
LDVTNQGELSPEALTTKRVAQSTSKRRGPKMPGKIADGYLFSQVAESTVRGLGMFVMLLLFFAVITATRKMIENSLDWKGAVELIVYQIPRIFLFTLPMAVCYGTVQAFASLSGFGEIIALWAGGMSLKRMMRAPLMWGLMLAIFAFWMQEAIVPNAEQQKDKILTSQIARSTAVQKDFSFKQELPDGGTREISAESLSLKDKVLMRPVVRQLNAQGEFQSELIAEKGTWDPKIGKWVLINGKARQWDISRKDERGRPLQGNFKLSEVDAPPPETLANKKALTFIGHLEKANFEMVSIAELNNWRTALQNGSVEYDAKERRKMIDGATYGIHDKIATPLVCLALVLVGAPLGIRPQRSTGGFAMGLSLAVLLLYYVVWTWATQLGKYGAAPPLIMAYLPFVITFVVGLVLVVKKSR